MEGSGEGGGWGFVMACAVTPAAGDEHSCQNVQCLLLHVMPVLFIYIFLNSIPSQYAQLQSKNAWDAATAFGTFLAYLIHT